MIGRMPGTSLKRAIESDRAVDRRAMLIAATVLVAFGIVNVLSNLTEAERSGYAADARMEWLWEFSSVALLLSLMPAVAWLTRRAPLNGESWRWALPVHLLGSMVFSALHVTGMVLIRKAISPLLWGQAYVFFADRPAILRESIYEYRKDVLSYAFFFGLFVVVRHAAQQSRELEAARSEATRSRRLTLKCGGSTILLDAASVVWAQAAGNYVEIKAADATHLARITLKNLEEQLASAGVPVVRCHRSWLVHAERIVEIVPAGEGDVKLRMDDGEQVPGSRRYRDRLPGRD